MSSQATAMTDNIPANNNNINEPTSTTKQQLLESSTISGMEGKGGGSSSSSSSLDIKERNVTAFYQVVWPLLEKEGGWTLVKGTGPQEGLSIFFPPGTTPPTNSDMVHLSNRILAKEQQQQQQQHGGGGNDDNYSHATPKQQQQQQHPPPSSPHHHNHHHHHHPVPQLVHQQGPWKCICGTTNEDGTIRCETCFGWREGSSTTTPATNTTTASNSDNKQSSSSTSKNQSTMRYYTKMKHVIHHILQKETIVERKAAEAYEDVVNNAIELFGGSISDTDHNNNNNDDDDDDTSTSNNNNHHHHQDIPMSPTAQRMTRQRFSDIAWKENRTHYEKSSSRVGSEYQVDVLPVVGSYRSVDMNKDEEEEEVLYDQVWDQEKAQKSGKIDFIDHRVKSSIKEPAYDMLHQRNYELPGFYAEVTTKAQPTDCSHWTAEERAKFRKLVFEKHEDMWQISEALGRPVRECVTYYLGKFKTSKDFRSLRRVMEKARDENPFKYPGEILCDKCGKGGKLVYCDSCDCHYHLTCQDPPLVEVPEGNDWKCNKCVEKDDSRGDGGGGDDAEEETDDKTEDSTSKSGVGMTEMDTSNAEDAEEEVSSFDGKGSDMNDDAELTSSAANKQQDVSNDHSVEEKGEVVPADVEGGANDAMSDSSASAGAGGEKRPSSGENDVGNADTPQHQAKKVKSLTDLEEQGGTLTSDVGGGEMTGLSEMAPPPLQQPPTTR